MIFVFFLQIFERFEIISVVLASIEFEQTHNADKSPIDAGHNQIADKWSEETECVQCKHERHSNMDTHSSWLWPIGPKCWFRDREGRSPFLQQRLQKMRQSPGQVSCARITVYLSPTDSRCFIFSILKSDPYHCKALTIYVGCLMELKEHTSEYISTWFMVIRGG